MVSLAQLKDRKQGKVASPKNIFFISVYKTLLHKMHIKEKSAII